MHVLVTDDSYRPSLGIVRSLGRKGIRVSVLASPTAAALASRSRYCSGRYVVPPPGEPSFYPAVLDLLRRVHFDLIIPVGYASTLALTRHKSEISALTHLEIGDGYKIRSAADKCYAQELAASAGVPTPRTLCPHSPLEVVERAGRMAFPVVVKPASEEFKEPVRYAHSAAELVLLYRLMTLHRNGSHRLPIIQEFIPGYGCGFFALYEHGVAKRIFMHRRVRETPPRGGISCCAESFYDPRLKDYGTRLLNRLEWHGVAMVEFRYDERDHDYKLMEINPKFWGSLELALAAGVDFPFALCQIGQGRDLTYSEKYERSLRFHWPLLELQHVWKRPASLGAVLRDLLDPRVKSNIRWFDLKPNLCEPFARLSALWRRRRQEELLPHATYSALEESRN